MINKKLINLCKESKKYIALTILVNWIATLCNIITIILIGQFINKISNLDYNLSISTIIIIAMLLIVRCICNILSIKGLFNK